MGMKKHYFYGPTGEFLPLEKRLEVKNNQKKFVIGIPKEIAFQEHRVSLVPDSVKMLVHNGHEVLVEDGAGEYARFSNHDYAEVGGEIVRACNLRKELNEYGIHFSVEDWYEFEIDFLKKHNYFTRSAYYLRNEKKLANLELVIKLLEKLKV
jgi:alanine dehydrogenase